MPNPQLYLEDPDFAKYEAMLELGDKLEEVNENIKEMDKSHEKMESIKGELEEMEDELREKVEQKFNEFKNEIDLVKKEIPDFAKVISLVKGEKGETGEEGYTPQAGIDFFTEEEKKYFQEKCTPVKGKDYFTKQEIKEFIKKSTPIFGQDYFTAQEIKDLKKDVTPIKGKDYFDGEKGEKGETGIGKDGKEGKEGKMGPMPKHEWMGASIRFEMSPGVWGKWVDLGGSRMLGRGGGDSGTSINEESVTGTKNGVNLIFTLAHTPLSGTLKLYLNGARLFAGAGNDYTLVGNTITMLSVAPDSNANFIADYRY